MGVRARTGTVWARIIIWINTFRQNMFHMLFPINNFKRNPLVLVINEVDIGKIRLLQRLPHSNFFPPVFISKLV